MVTRTYTQPSRGLSRTRKSTGRKIVVGAYVNDPGIAGTTVPGGNRGLTTAHIAGFEALANHAMGLYMISYPWGQGGFNYTSAAAAKAAGRDYCELWRCNSYQNGGDTNRYNCANLVANGAINGAPTELTNLSPMPIGDGTFQTIHSGTVFSDYVTGWAKGAKAYGRTVYCRLFHEFNLNTAPFNPCIGNTNGNTAAQFVAAWQQIVTWIRSAGADNVKFIWNPSANGTLTAANGDSRPFLISTYPGDAYVDIVALDVYNQCGQVTTAATPTVAPVGGYGMNGFAASSKGTWSSATTYAINDTVTFSSSPYYAIQAGANHQPDISPTFWAAGSATATFGGIQFLDAPNTVATSATIAAANVPTFATNSYTTAIVIATSSDPNASVLTVTDTHHGGGAPWAGAKKKKSQQTTGGGVMEVWVYDRYDDQLSGTLHPGVTVTWDRSATVGFSLLLVSGMAVSTFDTAGGTQGNNTTPLGATDAALSNSQDLILSMVAAYTNQGSAPSAPVSNVAQSIGLTQLPAAFASSLASAPDRFVSFVPNAGMLVPLVSGSTPTYGPAQMRGLRFMGYFTTGTWVAATFNPGDIVVYNGTSYVFQKPTGLTTANPGADNGNAASGASWNNADGMNWACAYQSGQTYNRLDCVYSSGQYWMCTATGVSGIPPTNDTVHWQSYTPVGPIVAWQLGTSSPWGEITLCLTPLPHSLQTEQGNTTATTGNSSIPSTGTPWNTQFKWNGFAAQFGNATSGAYGPYQVGPNISGLLGITTANGALGNASSKPWMIAEVGSSAIGGNKGQWLTDMFTAQLKNNAVYQQIKYVIFWHDTTQLYVAKGLVDAASVTAFRTALSDPTFAT